MTLDSRASVAAIAVAGATWLAACAGGATDPAPPPASPPPRPTTVVVSPATAELASLGATVQFRAQVNDQNGQAMTGASVTWASGAAAVATVNSTGLVTAAGNGTATVSATAGSASGTATVTVAQRASAVAVMPPPADSVVAGDTLRLTAEASDANGHPVTGAEFEWSSSDAAVATVDAAGLVTAVRSGTATITASAGEATGDAVLRVIPPSELLEPLLDSLMVAFTGEHDIGAAAIGLMKDGVIVYERVFGWKDRERTIPLPEDAMMRLASVTKPFTAAAVHELAREGALDLDAFVFDLGQTGGGLLDIEPFAALGDARLAEITVRHLLAHRGGWDRSIAGDLTYREIAIAEAMSVPSPPGRLNTVRYILGQPLEFDPGSERSYSNIGYLVLGLIIEEVSGTNYLSLLFERVLSPLGVHDGDVILGRTFPQDRSDREPWYDYGDWRTRNVFDPDGPRVRWPEGGWDHEARVAQGRLVASTAPILRFLDVYQVAGDDIGTRRRRPEPIRWRWNHTGSLPGTSSVARQRWDGINYVVLFNKGPQPHYGRLIRDIIDDILDNTRIAWPHAHRAREWD
ncbi:MAG: serine hydrolase [Gammaproteobacteria bacterium]|nr:serine hydrolase [Gammaproteobacteria bacterium]